MTKDIEREAFEKALAGNKIHNLKVCTIFDDEKNEYFASDVCDPSEDHIVESINLSWRMWQAAKAQAVMEITSVGNELQSWVAVWSFKARHDHEDYIVVDANLLAEKIEKLTGANA